MKTRNIISGLIIVMIFLSVQTLNAQSRRYSNHNRYKKENTNRKSQKPFNRHSNRYSNSNSNRHYHHSKVKPSYKYGKMPQWGYSYNAIPKRSRAIVHTGSRYHYYNGIFYKPVGSGYVISRAPVGVRVHSVPVGHVRIVMGPKVYYYYYGTYYVKSPNTNDYVTVAPPVGARVDALPDGYRKVYIEDRTYYEFEGVYYKAVIDQYGEVWYEVVG